MRSQSVSEVRSLKSASTAFTCRDCCLKELKRVRFPSSPGAVAASCFASAIRQKEQCPRLKGERRLERQAKCVGPFGPIGWKLRSAGNGDDDAYAKTERTGEICLTADAISLGSFHEDFECCMTDSHDRFSNDKAGG